MKETLKLVILLCISTITAFFIGKELFPRTKEVPKLIPHIVTQYDTVTKSPEWLQDSIKKWKKVVYTTDTINLTPVQIVISDEKIPIREVPNADTSFTPPIHPLLSYSSGGKFGDTAIVRSFSLRDGTPAVSKVIVAGVLTGIDAEVDNPTPRLNFEPFPPKEQHNWFYPIKHILIGAGIGSAVGFGACVVK